MRRFAIAVLLVAPLVIVAASLKSRSDAPEATIDLATPEGVDVVRGLWRYSDVNITRTAFRAPNDEGQPGSTPNETYDIEPHAGESGFDDSGWQVIAPESLSTRRNNGRLCFSWYRINITIPEAVRGIKTAGSTVT